MNFTVKLDGQLFGGQDSSFHQELGTIQLHPSNDGLFVIGALNTSMGSSGSALFPGMAMQPVESPISNRAYQFSFAASFGDDLLRQVQAVTVQIELQRCTMGQFMTVRGEGQASVLCLNAAYQYKALRFGLRHRTIHKHRQRCKGLGNPQAI